MLTYPILNDSRRVCESCDLLKATHVVLTEPNPQRAGARVIFFVCRGCMPTAIDNAAQGGL